MRSLVIARVLTPTAASKWGRGAWVLEGVGGTGGERRGRPSVCPFRDFGQNTPRDSCPGKEGVSYTHP